MPAIQLIGFIGEAPKILPRLLPNSAAQRALNTRLNDGGLTPVRRPRRDFSFPTGSGVQSFFLSGSDWVGFSSKVDVAPGPVAGNRLYYTGDGTPKMRVDGNVYELAVSSPNTKLTAAVTGTGSGDPETIRYAYTWVTEYDEESQPSPLTDDITWEPGETVTLSGFEAIPSGRAINRQRIYRVQTGETGSSDLFFIAERTASQTDFVDDVDPEDIQEPVPSLDWTPPPAELSGITSLFNGMIAGFVGKDLYFCEPYRPHAWPDNYVLTMDYNIVGLGAFGNTVIVVTEGTPYRVSGISPDSMVMDRVELNLPCINADSIQDLGYSVVYATHEGIVSISQGNAGVVSKGLLSRQNWQELNPGTMAGGQYEGRYFLSYRYTDAMGRDQRGTLIFDLTGEQGFIIRSSVYAEAFYYEVETGSLYYLHDGAVFQYDAPGQINEAQTWRSKQFYLPRPTNFGVILVDAENVLSAEDVDAIEADIAQIKQDNEDIVAAGGLTGAINAAQVHKHIVNGDETMPIPSFSQFSAVAVYADGRLVATTSTVNKSVRLPSGFKARMWEVSVNGDMQISQVALATTANELMGVP